MSASTDQESEDQIMVRITSTDYFDDDELQDVGTKIDVYVSSKIGTLVVDQYGMSPTRAMLDLVGVHAEKLGNGEHAEYHAKLPDGPIIVVIVRDRVE